jgi:hypothetical protein
MLKSFNKFLGIATLTALQFGIFDLTFNAASAIAEEEREGFDICAGELNALEIPPEKTSAACADALDPEELSVCVLSIAKNTEILAEDALNSCYRVRRPLELARCVVRIDEQILAQQNKTEEEVEEVDEEETEMEEPETPPTETETPETEMEQPETPPTETETPETEMEEPETPPTETETPETEMEEPETPPTETETPETEKQSQTKQQTKQEVQPETTDGDLVIVALDSCRTSLSPVRFSDCTIGLNQQIPKYPMQLAMTTCLSAEDSPSELLPVSNESR